MERLTTIPSLSKNMNAPTKPTDLIPPSADGSLTRLANESCTSLFRLIRHGRITSTPSPSFTSLPGRAGPQVCFFFATLTTFFFVLCRTGFRAKDLPEIERALLGHAEFTELKVSGAHITRRWLEAALKYSD